MNLTDFISEIRGCFCGSNETTIKLISEKLAELERKECKNMEDAQCPACRKSLIIEGYCGRCGYDGKKAKIKKIRRSEYCESKIDYWMEQLSKIYN